MLTQLKKWLVKTRSLFLAKLGKGLMNLLMRTCRLHFEGVEQFCQLAAKEKCILMLWHNRLAIVPFILCHYTPRFQYAAVISASRDGDILSHIAHSYPNGQAIRVSHQARYQALRDIVRYTEEQKGIVIITPDGPRGPRYEVKPGIALAALETQAYVVGLNWKANRYWEFKTWDRLRLPKPFTTIHVQFEAPIRLNQMSLIEAKAFLKESLSQD